MPAPRQTHAAASRLAQLLGEVIIQHAPHTAKINSEQTVRSVNDWLEGLEQHSSRLVGPFLQRILDSTNMPAELRGLLEEAINPQAAFSAALLQIFMWSVVGNLITSTVAPFEQAVVNDLWKAAVDSGISLPLDPSSIATAAGRGLNLGDPPTVDVPQWAYDQGAQTGRSADQINLLASLIGLPPALQELFELYRRGVISIDQVKQGLREGDFRDDWIDFAVQLVHAWLTPLDFVRAAVQAQMPYSDARDWAGKTGLDTSTPVAIDTGGTEATPDMFGLAFSIAGRPPGPAELARMALRGIIDWSGTGADKTTFEQGIAESDVKTKWTAALQALSEYVPPPREVGTLLERGAITSAQAQQLWQESGVPPALAAGYVYITEQQHVTQDKLLALGEIKTGYYDGLFSREQALGLLSDLGRRGQVAEEILSIIDFRREIAAINAVTRRVETLFGTHKMTATAAKQALTQAGIDPAQAGRLLNTWSALRQSPFLTPTPREIALAVRYKTLTTDQALAELGDLGYQPRDAAIILSAYTTAAVTPLPPAGTSQTG